MKLLETRYTIWLSHRLAENMSIARVDFTQCLAKCVIENDARQSRKLKQNLWLKLHNDQKGTDFFAANPQRSNLPFSNVRNG